MNLLILRRTQIDRDFLRFFDACFRVDDVQDESTALAALNHTFHDMLLIDDETGAPAAVALIREIRRRQNPIPVVKMSDRENSRGRVELLNAGADDCITLPMTCDELLARIQAIHRRSKGHTSNIITHGGITLDLGAKRVFKNGRSVPLSAREFDILKVFLLNVGQVLSKQRIESQLYTLESGVESNAVEVHISHLRKKLGHYLIKTIRGMGYLVDHPSPRGKADHGISDLQRFPQQHPEFNSDG